MSTQFDVSIVDLDRTEELPVLDVDAYEASLAATDQNLSRTDSWNVEGLRAVDGDVEEPDEEPRSSVRMFPTARAPVQAESLTVNVERILKRIAELEAQITASHETNATLQRDREAVEAERIQEALRIEALQADNARLCKVRVQSDEIARRAEQQLSEREEAMTSLEKALIDEQCLAAHLSQQLAAKLMDCERADTVIESRDRKIDDLIRREADLNQRLHQEAVVSADLTARLAVAESLLLEHGDVIERRDAQLVQKDAELAQIRSEHATATGEFEQAKRALGEQAEDLKTQLRAARDERAQMGSQLDKARAREKNLADQIFSRDNQIATLQADLAVHTEALCTIQRDVSRIGEHADKEPVEAEHMLEPVEHDAPTLHLTRGVLTVGRTTDNDISVPSKLVSRCHARLLAGPTGVIVEDADSLNGCYVNGERVRQHLLSDGDLLELGDMRYRLRTRLVRDRRNPSVLRESLTPPLLLNAASIRQRR
jgi:hypothetical protein